VVHGIVDLSVIKPVWLDKGLVFRFRAGVELFWNWISRSLKGCRNAFQFIRHGISLRCGDILGSVDCCIFVD
jgi:hypothetical protein